MSSEQAHHETHFVILGQYAGFVTRLIAWLVDYLIVTSVVTVLGALAGFFFQFLGSKELPGTNEVAQAIVVVLATVIAIAFYLLYFLGFWMLAGQTPGKRLMGVRIVKTNGERINVRSAVVRLLGYLLSFCFFLGYLWVLVDNRRQAWHDKLAGTMVVYSWPEEGALTTVVGKKYLGFRARRQAREQAKEMEQQQA